MLPRWFLASAALPLLACGGEPPPPAAAPPADSSTITGTITPQTPAQHKLAHLKTPDGMITLVLDRTGDKPKYRIDGSPDIIELTQREERESWEHRLEGFYLVAPDGKRPFFLDVGGGITF